MSGLHPVGGAPVGSGGVVAAADSGATLVEVVDSFMLADASAPTAREVLVSGVSLSAALVTHLKFLASDGPFYGGGVDVGGYIRVGESFVMSDIAASKATFYNEVVDGFSLKDLCGIVYRLLISDGFSMTDSVEERARKLIAVVDTLLAADLVTSKLSAVYVLASAFAAEDVAARTLREEITDAVVISELLEKALRGYHAIVEPIVMADSATMRARFTIPLVDGVTIADSADSKGILLQAIVDGVGFAAALDIEDGHYYAWVVDAESRAAWKYDNYGFNSMAQFGDLPMGAMHDGVYVLDGDDDEGEDINAVLRTGILDFGTSALKRPSLMYILASRSGDLVAKVFIVNEDTNEVESHWYKLEGGASQSKRQDRIEPDGGLESVTLQFELINIAGADFDVDEMRILAVALNRRY